MNGPPPRVSTSRHGVTAMKATAEEISTVGDRPADGRRKAGTVQLLTGIVGLWARMAVLAALNTLTRTRAVFRIEAMVSSSLECRSKPALATVVTRGCGGAAGSPGSAFPSQLE